MGLLYNSRLVVVSGISYQSTVVLSNASQCENKMLASFMTSQSMVTSSTLSSSLTNHNLSSVNFCLAQHSDSGLFCGGLN